ncbi:type I restriction endonuclease subunit R [Lentisalinibacter orientalis]|uniref:type I restriction endonuclease subunit R n=1 Tax=Lentisalinibacter orientalis TaxID=2992241 RepID=UPI003870B5AD
MSPHGYTEDASVERPSLELLSDLGWETANLYQEWAAGRSSEGRQSEHDVFLVPRLRSALRRLNPDVPDDGIEKAIETLTADRSKLLPVNANNELYDLLKGGIKIKVPDGRGGDDTTTVLVVDWRDPPANDFFAASQFWVAGDMYRKRPDVIGFVNGIPLLLFEFKASQQPIKHAYDYNLTDYRSTIPQLFTPNAFVLLSNGSATKIGSSFAPWEHFYEWKRINDEGERGIVSLETAIMGTCEKDRLLDLIENFIVYEEERGGLIKKLAKNHQYLGVNKAIHQVQEIRENQGRLGVFWHTQGSGKSLSMVFFTQKVLRTVPGSWTFVVVTDREELDDQIYGTFAATGAVTEEKAQATSGKHLQQLLQENHRYVFTLIQKFQARDGTEYPKLSDRDDIIVITDEAHRSQYDTLALNMRNALPNAAFLGFTGTPLISGEEERTREVFGDYVSVYNFSQSVADGATVPLYYENRIPELQLTNENLNDDLEDLLENALLDEEQEKKLAREFGREYHLITRDERLDKVAEDVVDHFIGRGHRGKAMFIAIDKATAVKMYDRVQARWKDRIEKLKAAIPRVSGAKREALEDEIRELEATDMAVVVSQAQNEVAQMAEKGVDIVPHRKRLVEEDLDEKFKDPHDPLRLVFVCAMWITGFDVPSCSTIYLDKPMRNHTLMQTIARANRRHGSKEAGLIVDYVGVFRNLQKALAIYGGATGGGDTPIKNKEELVEYLKQLIAEVLAFCHEKGIDTKAIQDASGFERVRLLDDAVEVLIESEETKKNFLSRAAKVNRIYRAVLPDKVASQFAPDAVLLSVLAQKIRSLTPPPDISEVMGHVEELLDRSIAAEGYEMPDTEGQEHLIDLSQIDFDKLREQFSTSRKRTEAEKLKAMIERTLQDMVVRNRSRVDYLEKFQQMIDEYNSGSKNIEAFFEELIRFAQSLNEEDQRGVREGLSEEELAIFDILTRPGPDLSKSEEANVKRVCKEMMATLKREQLVLNWRVTQRNRARVRRAIELQLDKLPESYGEDIFEEKCEQAYRHVYNSYFGDGQSVYA